MAADCEVGDFGPVHPLCITQISSTLASANNLGTKGLVGHRTVSDPLTSNLPEESEQKLLNEHWARYALAFFSLMSHLKQ